MAKSIPDGYHAVTPYLSLRGAAAALDFYKRAFGATEILRIPGPEGTIGHAEIRIGDSPIMLADEFAEMEFLSPLSRGGTTVHIHLYVEDADATLAQAVAAGGTLKRPARDEFYGDRTGDGRGSVRPRLAHRNASGRFVARGAASPGRSRDEKALGCMDLVTNGPGVAGVKCEPANPNISACSDPTRSQQRQPELHHAGDNERGADQDRTEN